MRASADLYAYQGLRQSNGHALALFRVDLANGQTRDELLGFTAIEVRIRLWDEAVQLNPALPAQDPSGAANYAAFVQALVDGLKFWQA